MDDIVERLRGFKSAAAQSWAHEAADEIESLRAQLAEVTRERNAFRRQYSAECDNHYCTKEQLLATQAHAARMKNALEIIAGKRQCIDNLLSNVDIANAALPTPINLDALHEDRARECERLRAIWMHESHSYFTEIFLQEEAAAHRAKKEGK